MRILLVGMVVLLACKKDERAEYAERSKRTEASLQLNKLAKNSKVAYNTDGHFIIGKTRLTPSERCCTGPDGKCSVSTAAWTKDPVWMALDFQIDEPNRFQYSYESDGKTAVALAVGDIDCDGTAITFRLELTAPNGNATATITEPPPNAD